MTDNNNIEKSMFYQTQYHINPNKEYCDRYYGHLSKLSQDEQKKFGTISNELHSVLNSLSIEEDYDIDQEQEINPLIRDFIKDFFNDFHFNSHEKEQNEELRKNVQKLTGKILKDPPKP